MSSGTTSSAEREKKPEGRYWESLGGYGIAVEIDGMELICKD